MARCLVTAARERPSAALLHTSACGETKRAVLPFAGTFASRHPVPVWPATRGHAVACRTAHAAVRRVPRRRPAAPARPKERFHADDRRRSHTPALRPDRHRPRRPSNFPHACAWRSARGPRRPSIDHRGFAGQNACVRPARRDRLLAPCRSVATSPADLRTRRAHVFTPVTPRCPSGPIPFGHPAGHHRLRRFVHAAGDLAPRAPLPPAGLPHLPWARALHLHPRESPTTGRGALWRARGPRPVRVVARRERVLKSGSGQATWARCMIARVTPAVARTGK